MAIRKCVDEKFIDTEALATRVTLVTSTDSESSASHAPTFTRVNFAATTVIGDSNSAYSITVVQEGTGVTIDGVSVPTGYTANLSAEGNDKVSGVTVVTSATSDVVILELA